MNEITEMLEPMVQAMEDLVEGDMADRMAKMTRKSYDAFREEGFTHEECREFTKVLLKKTSIQGG